MHWPDSGGGSPVSRTGAYGKDPKCNPTKPATYNATACRLDTWRALLRVWRAGRARAIGVSNFNETHLDEIARAGLPLPAVNQCPYNPHARRKQASLRAYCAEHKILFTAYSPLGVPDTHEFPPVVGAPTLLSEPAVAIAARARNVTRAQVLLRWLLDQGIPTHPRTMDPTHMRENLAAAALAPLDAATTAALDALGEDWCADDPEWYECTKKAAA